MDFLEQEINNVGSRSANKVIANRSDNQAGKPPKPQPPAAQNNNDAGLDDLADLEDLMEGGEAMGTAGAKDFMAEAFCMVFKDEYT